MTHAGTVGCRTNLGACARVMWCFVVVRGFAKWRRIIGSSSQSVRRETIQLMYSPNVFMQNPAARKFVNGMAHEKSRVYGDSYCGSRGGALHVSGL